MVYVISHWPSPGQPGACQDNFGGNMIPMKRQTTAWAVMPADPKVFADLLAAHASLARATGIDFHIDRPSLFSFVAENAQEAGPASVTDCPGEPAGRQHPLDVERFDSDESEGKDKTTGNLVVMLTSQVANTDVNFLEATNGLSTVLTTFLLA